MNFNATIEHQNTLGYGYHVFQEFGSDGEKRGLSMSFKDKRQACHHADIVPGGHVYNRDGESVYWTSAE